jgi:hypothetical protein
MYGPDRRRADHRGSDAGGFMPLVTCTCGLDSQMTHGDPPFNVGD